MSNNRLRQFGKIYRDYHKKVVMNVRRDIYDNDVLDRVITRAACAVFDNCSRTAAEGFFECNTDKQEERKDD